MDEDLVARNAAVLGLQISVEKTKTVAAQLRRIEEIARSLDAVELDAETDEIAPVWRP